MYYDKLRLRIKHLQEKKGGPVNVTLIYADGKEQIVGSLDALNEIVCDHSIVDVKCQDPDGQSLFQAFLQAEQESGGNFGDLEELKD